MTHLTIADKSLQAIDSNEGGIVEMAANGQASAKITTEKSTTLNLSHPYQLRDKVE